MKEQITLFDARSRLLSSSFSFHALCKEKERELCVRERLAEDKLARAETLVRNHSLLQGRAVRPPAGGPGTSELRRGRRLGAGPAGIC